MRNGRSVQRDRIGVISAVVVTIVLLLALTGCGKEPSSKPKGTETATATGGYTVAKSALSTVSPDAKLLLVQTAEPVTATSTPVWAYLFGSPSTDKTYIVYVRDGKAMGASEYGTAGLEKSEWGSVPAGDQWKVDSDEAYRTATESSKVKKPESYNIGLLTYVPKSEAASATTKPLIWYVYLESATATAVVEVDAKTGKAAVK